MGFVRVVRGSNFFNPTQPFKRLTQRNPSQSGNFGFMTQLNPQPNRTPYNQQQTRKTILCTLFHRDIITVSKTPVNKHDIVSIITLSVEIYQVSLASVNFWKFLRPTTQPTHQKSKNLDPTLHVGRPNPWTTLSQI